MAAAAGWAAAGSLLGAPEQPVGEVLDRICGLDDGCRRDALGQRITHRVHQECYVR